MKNKILMILFLCHISCKNHIGKTDFKEKAVQITKETVFIDKSGDTIKTDSFNLKNNYKLIIFPAIENNEEVINFRLIKGKKDNTYLLVDTFIANYMRYFHEIDFHDYFVLHGNGGGTSHSYFWLYDKATGKEELTGITHDFDLKNELILYEDEGKDYELFIYDVNTKKKTLIDIPKSFLDKHICMQYNDSEKYLFIKDVTKDYYLLAFKNCPSSIVYKIKK
ncbi:hypothetical protein [Flavobacterium aestivum]|uniref:hypothetical protein n=1 Tax=Flavobacterium aestivum TaxID=3003257 RepID=UPI0022861034|nr:hypothetical protein [Flavobacterium aestivum]